jgi:hypothetical protein
MAKNSTFTVPPSPTGIYTIPVGVGGGGGTFAAIGGTGGFGNVNNGTGITKVPSHLIDDSVLNHFIKDHAIEGQTIMAEYILPPNYHGMTEPDIKGLLIEKLIHEMYGQKNIEFTQMKRLETDEMVYRARIHVVPDTQVRIIRELKDARKAT